VDPIDEASSGTSLVASMDRKWLSDEELPPSAINDDSDPDLPSQPINTPVPPEPPPPQLPPSRSTSEEDVVPAEISDQKPHPTSASEGATSSSEGGVDSDTVSAPVPSPKCKNWDEELPEKRRRKPNPKYVQDADKYATHQHKSGKLRDYDRGSFMNLDWKSINSNLFLLIISE
jgi:hypothetical protein